MKHPSTVVLLGSTGSIGTRALDVARAHPDRIRVTGLFAWRRVEELADQVRAGRVPLVGIGDPEAAARFDRSSLPPGGRLLVGPDAATEMAADPSSSVVVNAVVGSAGLSPSLAAVSRGARLALANKESLVVAGKQILSAARRHGATILPIDSEHSGLFQCLEGRGSDQVRRLTLTASGGPFRDRPGSLRDVTPAEALKHPVWPMGDRITIDSATLMNKGLEVLEAHWLFGVPLDAIDVLVHRQSIVHALVEFVDGSVLAQLARPDMILPVQYALSWPDRWSPPLPPLDLGSLGRLDFEPPDHERFPCLRLAIQAGKAGGVMPAVMNAADEIAVAAFLAGEIRFTDIPFVIGEVMDRFDLERSRADRNFLEAATGIAPVECDEATFVTRILAADAAAREASRGLIRTMAPPVAG